MNNRAGTFERIGIILVMVGCAGIVAAVAAMSIVLAIVVASIVCITAGITLVVLAVRADTTTGAVPALTRPPADEPFNIG